MGFDRVFALKGGFREWVEAGYTIEEKESKAPGCIPCHRNVTPEVVAQWEESEHAAEVNNVSCSVCHGDEHTGPDDAAQAKIPAPRTCRTCHERQGSEFAGGKHALARKSVRVGRPLHWPAMATTGDRTQCLRCHRIGLGLNQGNRTREDRGSAGASCGSCHSSHTFSPREAASPRACLPCHRSQWEAYSASPHGERHELKRQNLLPEGSRAPTCQTCHMPRGEHGVRTAWGSLGLKWPPPDTPAEWSRAQEDILRGLGYIDARNRPTRQFRAMRETGIVRSKNLAWQKERIRMKKTCFGCHDASLVKTELDRAEDTLRRADLLMAKALRAVAESPDATGGNATNPDTGFPSLIRVYASDSRTEQLLGLMFRRHRKRALTGAFHLSPETAYRRGLDRMRLDLSEIQLFTEEPGTRP